jgi:hypothetical protein
MWRTVAILIDFNKKKLSLLIISHKVLRVCGCGTQA